MHSITGPYSSLERFTLTTLLLSQLHLFCFPQFLSPLPFTMHCILSLQLLRCRWSKPLATYKRISVPEMRIWSILLIKSDLKWCIHLSRSLFLYSNTTANDVHNCTLHTVWLPLKPRCWEPPGPYLCTPEPDIPGCVISIQKSVKPVNATSAERRPVRKRGVFPFIYPTAGI